MINNIFHTALLIHASCENSNSDIIMRTVSGSIVWSETVFTARAQCISQIRLHGCTCWAGATLSAYVQRAHFRTLCLIFLTTLLKSRAKQMEKYLTNFMDMDHVRFMIYKRVIRGNNTYNKMYAEVVKILNKNDMYTFTSFVWCFCVYCSIGLSV